MDQVFYDAILKVLEPHRGPAPQSCVDVIKSIIAQRDAAVTALAEAALERTRWKRNITAKVALIASRCSACGNSDGGFARLTEDVRTCLEVMPDGWEPPDVVAELRAALALAQSPQLKSMSVMDFMGTAVKP